LKTSKYAVLFMGAHTSKYWHMGGIFTF